MNTENDQTDRTIIFAFIIGAIISLVGLIMAVVLDQLDQKQMTIPVYTFTLDDLPKPQPLIKGLDNTNP
jgi:hypothetical protein